MDEPTASPSPAADEAVPPSFESLASTLTDAAIADAPAPTARHPHEIAMDELANMLQLPVQEVTPMAVMAFIKSISIPNSTLAKLEAAFGHIQRAAQNGHAPSQDFIRLHGTIEVK